MATPRAILVTSWFRVRSSVPIMGTFRQLRAWKACHELALQIQQETAAWPRAEAFVLTTQVKRAALSAPANIAEGVARLGSREFRRFLGIALGSLSELEYLLLFARDSRIITPDAWKKVEAKRTEASRLTWLLYKRVSASVK